MRELGSKSLQTMNGMSRPMGGTTEESRATSQDEYEPTHVFFLFPIFTVFYAEHIILPVSFFKDHLTRTLACFEAARLPSIMLETTSYCTVSAELRESWVGQFRVEVRQAKVLNLVDAAPFLAGTRLGAFAD